MECGKDSTASEREGKGREGKGREGKERKVMIPISNTLHLAWQGVTK